VENDTFLKCAGWQNKNDSFKTAKNLVFGNWDF
jgi:hypothetical protein